MCPTTNVVTKNSSDSPSDTKIPPLPKKPTFDLNLPPTNSDGGNCSKNKRKRESIREESINAAVQKPPVMFTHQGSLIEVKESSPWVKTEFLGQGAYGSVHLAKCNNQERAIKTAHISRALSLMDEGKILRRLQSPFVVGCFGEEIVREGNDFHYNLVLEYCPNGSMGDFLKNVVSLLVEVPVKLFAKDVLSGLKYIHDRNIIHCDIKPDNLLLTMVFDQVLQIDRYLMKLGDFGLALEKGTVAYQNALGHRRGTKRYMAPELLSHGIVDFSVDIWSFGCSFLEMLSGRRVWADYLHLDYDDFVNLIGKSNLVPYVPNFLSAAAQDFLKKCLVKDPHARSGINELLNHPFLRLDV
ncbi:hypothetical protein CARUB_v10019212mg [Capsella rubella]|uniref:Protein kinase domain-containing protein n=2 Tax=Capsella rubella TaxID=81985 RepID=R0H8Z9_9BRAS|nr:hypothetical protein CARUB_v10019212mg [Capsella rubella]